MPAKGKKLRLPKARTITKKRVKVRLLILPLLSPNKLPNPKLPRQKLRILALVLRLFLLFTVFIYFFLDLYFVLIINEDTLLLFYML